jgi:hypothetical protein
LLGCTTCGLELSVMQRRSRCKKTAVYLVCYITLNCKNYCPCFFFPDLKGYHLHPSPVPLSYSADASCLFSRSSVSKYKNAHDSQSTVQLFPSIHLCLPYETPVNLFLSILRNVCSQYTGKQKLKYLWLQAAIGGYMANKPTFRKPWRW